MRLNSENLDTVSESLKDKELFATQNECAAETAKSNFVKNFVGIGLAGFLALIFLTGIPGVWRMSVSAADGSVSDEVLDEVEPIDLGDDSDEVLDEVEPIDLGDDSDEVLDEVEPIDLGDDSDEVLDEVEPIDLGDDSDEVLDEVEPIDLGDDSDEVLDEVEPIDTDEKTEDGVASDAKMKMEKETAAPRPAPQKESASAGSKVKSSGKTGKKTSKSGKTVSEKAVVPLDSILPANAAVIVQISSIRELNQRLEDVTETNVLRLLKTLGQGEYAKLVYPDSPIGAVLFPVGETLQWAVAIPAKKYRKLVELLGAEVSELSDEIPDGTVSVLSDQVCAAPYRGYLLMAANPRLIQQILKSEKFGDRFVFTPCEVKDPTVSVELTNTFIRFAVSRGRIGMEEFAPVFSSEMLNIQEGSEQMETAQKIFDALNNSIDWLDKNIACARIDLTVGEKESVLSTSFLPNPDSDLNAKLQDPYLPQISTSLENQNFLKVVPAYGSPFVGQVDISPTAGAELESPFNQIRHAEFSLMTPPENGNLAEAWCFFLEVDDAQSFVREILVPRAEEVGGKFGANTVGEIGEEMAFRMAERRIGRRMSRGKGAGRIDPEAAAERGEMIGSLLGGLIGKKKAKDEALKTYNFFGYDLYISDLVLFSQLKKRIREQEAGTAPHAMEALDGMNPGQMIGTVIQDFANGNASSRMDGIMQQFSGNLSEGTEDDPPLIAERNFMLILDTHHVLVVPGNDVILYEALCRWGGVREQYLPDSVYPQTVEDRASMPQYEPGFDWESHEMQAEENAFWHSGWSEICGKIASPETHTVRFAGIFSPADALSSLEHAEKTYQFQFSEKVREAIPMELPPFFVVYSSTSSAGNLFTTIPHDMTRAQFQKFVSNLPALLMKQ